MQKKQSYSCCNRTQFFNTPWEWPRCRRPLGRMPDSTRRWESTRLKPRSLKKPIGGDYSHGSTDTSKGRRIATADADDLRLDLGQVDHCGGLQTAEAAVEYQVHLMLEQLAHLVG